MSAKHLMYVLVLIFVFLSCWCQPQETGCENGWFGSQCQYKCRCTNNICDQLGHCKSGDRCDKGWFGPACQYVDEAYLTSNTREVTDGDDDTCVVDANTRRIVIPVILMISYLRVHFSADGFLDKIQLRVKQNASITVCPVSRNATVDTRTIDIHCSTDWPIKGLILFGPAARHVCSVYVSGGRNVALRQMATQSSTFEEVSSLTGFEQMSFPAKLAVDGNRDQAFYTSRTCAQTKARDPATGQLNVTLSLPRLVGQVVIYNRQNEFASHLVGFHLEIFNERGVRIYSMKDSTVHPCIKYNVLIPNLLVAKVAISTNSPNNMLNICELEIFGESVCTFGRYGRECEKVCNCYEEETCFVGTGGCASGCAVGYWGEDCSKICDKEKYGRDCNETCNQLCAKDTQGRRLCDHVSGECLHGCQIGYQPPSCLSVCKLQTYGLGCELSCSRNCQIHSNRKETWCNAVNGTCVYGCSSGYMTATCTVPCAKNTYGKKCQLSCSTGCLSTNSSRYQPCNHVTGVCLNGCSEGYNGTYCNIKAAAVSQIAHAVKNMSLVTIIALAAGATLTCAAVSVLLCRRKREQSDLEENLE